MGKNRASIKTKLKNDTTKKAGKMKTNTENEDAIVINSLGNYIHIISKLTKGTELYAQVINQFIECVNKKAREKHSKAWEYYSSTFLAREAQNIYYALVNLIDRVAPAHKNKLIEIYSSIYETIGKYYDNPENILKNIPDLFYQGIDFLLYDFKIPEEKQVFPIQIYYRGESSEKWRTLPSVLRENAYNPRESFYYHEIQVRSPKDFENQTHLNKLATMQHYGAPTRLLDLTSNSLNALYFACADEKQMSVDGKVSLFPVMPGSISYADSDRALILSCLPTLTSLEKISILDDINKCRIDTYNDDCECPCLNKLFLEICSEKSSFQRRIKFGDLLTPLLVQPNMINPRIMNQQGVFLLSGITFNDDDAENKIKAHMSQTHITIPANRKASILKELDSIGVNQATIYPNLDKIAGYLKSL